MKQRVSPVQKTLNTWAIILIMWSIYRAYFGTNMPMLFDELIAKPLIFLVPLYYHITATEKKNFWKEIDAKGKTIKSDMILGLAIGAVFMITAALAHWLKFQSFEQVIVSLTNPRTFFTFIVVALASSFSEEILSRGFVLKRLYEDSKNMVTAILFSSLLFFFLHIPILFSMPDVNGATLLQVMFTDFMLSIAVSILYLQRRDIFLPILIHAFYNISIYLFLAA